MTDKTARLLIEAPSKSEAEHQIQQAHKRHGYDWTEIDARVGAELVRFIPMAEALRRIAAGDDTVHSHFYGV